MRLICLLGLLVPLLAAGCDETAAAKKPSKKKPARATPVVDDRPKLPKVTQAEYASLEAAWADVENVATDPAGGQKLVRIELWLNLQGDKIAPELEAKIKDPSAGLATRLTACRVLARLGPRATPTLMEAASGEPKQLRLKAIESLGRIEPSSDEIVKKLLALVDDQDFSTRKEAIEGLADIGQPAKQAAGKLQSMLNNPNEDETIRSLAKAALKKVDPRTGLMKAE